jgi:hypothetical protein
MKTIEFEGKKYEVENWVNWVCRDYNKEVMGCEDEPRISETGTFWSPVGRWYYVDYKWQDSLTKV